jgi:hypothetical protein
MRRVTNLCIPALALLAITSLGCSAREKSICDKLITCEGGNDKDKDACVDSWIQNTQIYEAYKCGDAYSKYLDCVEASSICSSGKLKNDSCSAQSQAAITCINAASAYGVK